MDLVAQIQGFHVRKKVKSQLKTIDFTTLPLNLTHYEWEKFQKTKAGVKLHFRLIYMDKNTVYPDQVIVTNTKEHNRNQLEVHVNDKDSYMSLIV